MTDRPGELEQQGGGCCYWERKRNGEVYCEPREEHVVVRRLLVQEGGFGGSGLIALFERWFQAGGASCRATRYLAHRAKLEINRWAKNNKDEWRINYMYFRLCIFDSFDLYLHRV